MLKKWSKNKMFKKIGVLMLVCTVLMSTTSIQAAYEKTFSKWDGSVTGSSNLTWTVTSTGASAAGYARGNTLHISSAADFIAFRNMVLEGTTVRSWGGGYFWPFWQVTVSLECDIDLNNINLKNGVGGSDAQNCFWGIFNGNGHVIKNIKINPNEADGAAVQPGRNINLDASSATVNLAMNGIPGTIGLFSTLAGDNDNTVLNGGRLTNLHIENVDINLGQSDGNFKTTATADYGEYIGGLVGYAYSEAEIMSCSAKNVNFSGAPTNYTNSSQGRYLIGGLVGAINKGSLKNSYVNGVNFTGITPGYYTTWTFLSGLANNTGNINYLNMYSAGVNYDTGEFTYTNPTDSAQYTMKTSYHYDSLCYPGSSSVTFTSLYNIGFAYAETPLRIVDGAAPITAITLFNDTTNNITGTVQTLTANSAFTGDGGSSPKQDYMINVSAFTGGYPLAASERILVGYGKCVSGGAEINNFSSSTTSNVGGKIILINTTRAAQDVDIIIAGYKDGEIKNVASETVSVPVTAVRDNSTAASNAALGSTVDRGAYDSDGDGVVNNVGYRAITSTNTISTEGLDTIKVFCWNSISGMIPIAESTVINAG